MYKVLIAEDEMFVRIGLKNSIQWADFDMEVISDVSDGQAAWEAYNTFRPDVLISDLKMPVLDGMALIKKIRNHNKDIVIIILSCLEEFNLVRNAIHLGVMDYLPQLTLTTQGTEAVLS